MKFTIDLRYIVPPSVNILLQLSQGYPNWYSSCSSSSSSDHPLMLNKNSLSFIRHGFFFFILLLLLISIRLPLTLSVVFSHPIIQLRFCDFYISVLLAITLLASFVSPPSFFWFSYLIIIIGIYISPLFHPLVHVLKSYFQTIPTLFIVCTTTEPEPETTTTLETQPPPPQSVFQLNEIHNDQYLFLNGEPSSEHDSFEIIYGQSISNALGI
ncbi:hypothetical protein TEA_009265 [Camellia sinensis var. sinensis]|uniref:Uncharacterized protein n=1 Tax=Camellia sinensis var. sinensis TaxID=542762 RepID=A0A4S4DWP6_CAMSN|nr:hypothetical protein TEA_009265 [Camellia sinensis var. sinensis]